MSLVPSPPDLEAIVLQLGEKSRRGAPIAKARLAWPKALKAEDGGLWSEDLRSLRGTQLLETLSPELQQALDLQELRHLFSVSLYSETKLIRGLTGLRDQFDDGPVQDYLDIFIEEEERHSYWFGSFCHRYCDDLLPDELPSFRSQDDKDPTGLFFLCMAFLVESVLDVYNRRIARDMDLKPIVRRINHLHSVEEARHMSFDRAALLTGVAHLERVAGQHAEAELAELAAVLGEVPRLLLDSFCSPSIYAAAGLEDPEDASRQAKMLGPTTTIHAMALDSSLKFLRSLKLVP